MNAVATNSLFGNAVSAGVLSNEALVAINISDLGADINAAMGISIDDVQSSEVTLLSMLIDDSGSIRFVSGNTEAVRLGHNTIIEALSKTKQKDGILAMCSCLNTGLLYPYTPVDQAAQMDTQNYNPQGGTPLYDKTIVTLGSVIAKCQDLMDNGIACRTVTILVSDGADNSYIPGSSNHGAAKVKKIVNDMLRAENHIVAALGINDGQTDFRAVFSEMGIRDEWILTTANTPSEIRKAFVMLSQSAQRASQAAGTFSQTAMGGFATP